MAAVKMSISLTPQVAAALEKAARTQGTERSRIIDNALRDALIKKGPPLGPSLGLRPGRLEKLRDLAKVGRARMDREIAAGRISLGI